MSNYLNKCFAGKKDISVVVGHDCRNNSRLFAEISANIFSANGIKVYLFEDMRPTPEMSFAIRHLGCQSGIILTASHNPKEYNGYKAYWDDGAQVLAPHDKGIIDEVNKIASAADIKFEGNKELIQIIGKDIMFPPSIGLLIENPSFINNYTAFENLKTLASIRRRIDDNRIRETLTEIGLDPDDKRTFHKFSLGMKQRLGIAAAIMENPDIIILDEPINALDDTGTEQIRDILIRHRERGALIIIACHDADELNFLSDEIIEIVQGQIKPSKDDKKSA